MIFVLFEIVKNHQSLKKKGAKICLWYKTKTKKNTKMEILKNKKHCVQDFFKTLDIIFFLQNISFRLCFLFYNQGKPYFECITEKVFRCNLAVKWCKTPL